MRPANKSAASEYLTPSEARALLGISQSTLDRYQAAGRIQPLRFPSGVRRFLASDVEQLLTKREVS